LNFIATQLTSEEQRRNNANAAASANDTAAALMLMQTVQQANKPYQLPMPTRTKVDFLTNDAVYVHVHSSALFASVAHVRRPMKNPITLKTRAAQSRTAL
jgi:hypothetical protein